MSAHAILTRSPFAQLSALLAFALFGGCSETQTEFQQTITFGGGEQPVPFQLRNVATDPEGNASESETIVVSQQVTFDLTQSSPELANRADKDLFTELKINSFTYDLVNRSNIDLSIEVYLGPYDEELDPESEDLVLLAVFEGLTAVPDTPGEENLMGDAVIFPENVPSLSEHIFDDAKFTMLFKTTVPVTKGQLPPKVALNMTGEVIMVMVSDDP